MPSHPANDDELFDDFDAAPHAAPHAPTRAASNSDSIVALVENRRYEVGMACLRLSDFSVEMSGYCDDQAYSKTLSVLTCHEPHQIIIPPAMHEQVLEKIAETEFPDAIITIVPRRAWSETKGLTAVRHYSHRHQLSALETDVASKYLALAALAALLEWVEATHKTTFVKGTLRITFAAVEGHMLLDPSTIANLELLRNLRTGETKQSLFGALNHCITGSGMRYLRSSLVQPSTDLATITARLDAVSELLERPESLCDAKKVLPAFKDSDRLLKFFMQKPTQSGCARAKATITAVLQLKSVLKAAPTLAAALTANGNEMPQNELLRMIVANLTSPELAAIEENIESVIDDEATFCKRTSQRMLECLFAVRPKVCSFLDVTRQTLGDSTNEMDNIAAGYAERLGLTDLKLVYTDRRGYHLTLPASQRSVVEKNDIFIRINSQAKKTVACSTEQLAQLNNRCKDMISQILLSTESQLSKLQDAIRARLHLIFAVGESVALLDMLSSFATFVQMSGGTYVRPKMGEGAPLVLKQCRHPLLEAQGEASIVPNDVGITHATNFQLVTGPNMSGKSTYLRQVALVVLLSHVGCHVPADAATVPLLQRVFTRIGASDSLESNGSTFACEMRETTYIVRNLGPPSLVLVDELGRGTSNRDGASLAWAVAERLALSPNTFSLFATHYLTMANLRYLYPSHVKTLVLGVDDAPGRLRFLYSVKEGVATKQQYMTDFLAQVAGFPPEVCATAKQLAASIDFDPVDKPSALSKTLEAYSRVAERLVWLRRSTTMDEETQRHFLLDLKSRLKTVLQATQAPVAQPPMAAPRVRQAAPAPAPAAPAPSSAPARSPLPPLPHPTRLPARPATHATAAAAAPAAASAFDHGEEEEVAVTAAPAEATTGLTHAWRAPMRGETPGATVLGRRPRLAPDAPEDDEMMLPATVGKRSALAPAAPRATELAPRAPLPSGLALHARSSPTLRLPEGALSPPTCAGPQRSEHVDEGVRGFFLPPLGTPSPTGAAAAAAPPRLPLPLAGQGSLAASLAAHIGLRGPLLAEEDITPTDHDADAAGWVLADEDGGVVALGTPPDAADGTAGRGSDDDARTATPTPAGPAARTGGVVEGDEADDDGTAGKAGADWCSPVAAPSALARAAASSATRTAIGKRVRFAEPAEHGADAFGGADPHTDKSIAATSATEAATMLLTLLAGDADLGKGPGTTAVEFTETGGTTELVEAPAAAAAFAHAGPAVA